MVSMSDFFNWIAERVANGTLDALPYNPNENCIKGDLRKDGEHYKVWDSERWVWISGPNARPVVYDVSADA